MCTYELNYYTENSGQFGVLRSTRGGGRREASSDRKNLRTLVRITKACLLLRLLFCLLVRSKKMTWPFIFAFAVVAEGEKRTLLHVLHVKPNRLLRLFSTRKPQKLRSWQKVKKHCVGKLLRILILTHINLTSQAHFNFAIVSVPWLIWQNIPALIWHLPHINFTSHTHINLTSYTHLNLTFFNHSNWHTHVKLTFVPILIWHL